MQHLHPIICVDVAGAISFQQFAVECRDNVLAGTVLIAEKIEEVEQIVLQLIGGRFQCLWLLVVDLSVWKFNARKLIRNYVFEVQRSEWLCGARAPCTYRRNKICWCWTASSWPLANTSRVESTKWPKSSTDTYWMRTYLLGCAEFDFATPLRSESWTGLQECNFDISVKQSQTKSCMSDLPIGRAFR